MEMEMEMKPTTSFSNESVLLKMDENNNIKKINRINELQKIAILNDDVMPKILNIVNIVLPNVIINNEQQTLLCDKLRKALYNEQLLEQFYQKSISIHQCKNKETGDFLEKMVEKDLISKNLPYKKQVPIDENGIIVKRGDINTFQIVDFLVGNYLEVGDSYTRNTYISCKISCRERWMQDNFTHAMPPILYLLICIKPDYPSSKKFGENSKRKILCACPKKKDDRKHKLNLEDAMDIIEYDE